MDARRVTAGLACAALVLLGAAARAAEPDWPPVHHLRPDADHALEFGPKVRRVAGKPTVRSLVGPSDIPLPLELVGFLLDHPDLSAFVIKRRDLAPYRVEMLGPRRSSADDGDGTSGVVDLIDRGETSRLYYGEGTHDARLFPPIRADAVIAMTLEPRLDQDCRAFTRSSFRVWVRMRSRWVSGTIKLLRPFLQETVVRKFSKAFLVADQVGRLMARDPAGVSADAADFPGLSEGERAELARLLAGLERPPRCPVRRGDSGEFH